MADTGEDWVAVARSDEIDVDDAKQVKVNGLCIALFNVAGKFYATSDICTHAHAFLTEGYVQDGTVECPLHQGVFDIVTGKALRPPVTENLKTYPLRLDGESILIKIN